MTEPRFMPFMPKLARLIPTGEKTATTRSEAYGKAGTVLRTDVGCIRLLSVEKVRLEVVRDSFWREEGMASPAEFEQTWSQIHPRTGFQPQAEKHLHLFEFLGGAQ